MLEAKGRFPTTNTGEAVISLRKKTVKHVLVKSLRTGTLFPIFTAVSHIIGALQLIPFRRKN